MLGPKLLRRLGANVTRSTAPNGRNIIWAAGRCTRESSGSRDSRGADLGVAFDGDADRALFVNHEGTLVDGDGILYVNGLHLKKKGRLHSHSGHPAVVATVMSNLGLEVALMAEGIGMLRTAVGDKYVLEEMMASDLMLGGEQSGHVIFREYATTGDGLLTCLRVLEAMRETGRSLKDLTQGLALFPQKLVNIRVSERRPFQEMPAVAAESEAAEKHFDGDGRVLVRYSGTELLARVMIEARDEGDVERYCERNAGAIRAEIA